MLSDPLLIRPFQSCWLALDLVLLRSGVSCRKGLFRSTSSLVSSGYANNRASGRDVGEAILFYGCHSKEADALYGTELTQWEKDGVVSMRHAFSRSPQESKGCKHVQYVTTLSNR
jgi:hypothetical protein